MELIKLDDVMEKANEAYAREVLGIQRHRLPPANRPKIESRQLKAVAKVLIDEINARLGALAGWEE